MKQFKLTSAVLVLSFATPIFAVQANDTAATNDELRTELQQIQQRLAMLEAQEKEASVLSDTQFNFYGSLRPTFGLTHTNSDDVWDVGDANSRIGFAAEHQLGNGLVGFAKGEFKVDIKDDGDFGDAQFDGNKGSGGSDFVNAGIRYKTDLIYIAAAFYNKELDDGKDENTVGVTLAKSFNALYLAAAYQNIEKDDVDGTSLDGSTLDVVACYPITDSYKIKLGMSRYDGWRQRHHLC